MNIIVLVGRLARDPELKFGQSGKAYSRFSLAVSRTFPKGETDFINCVAFGKTAELIGEYLRKGSRVGIKGSLQMNRYEVNGEKRTSYDVLVDTLEFLDSKKDSQGDDSFAPSSYSAPKAADSLPSDSGASFSDDDDEFPF